MTGLIAGQSLYAVLTGDASLRKRPMRRIAEPLAAMGATILLRDGEYPPIAVRGGDIVPLDYKLPVASAQVKSCLLLAALGLKEGVVALEEPGPSRDHTERIFEWLGKPISRDGFRVEITAPIEEHSGFDFAVPSDMSSSAFYLVAGSIVPSSELRLDSVSLNPTRSGILDVLQAMGADLEIEEDETDSPEPVGSIKVRPASLKGTVIDGSILIRAIDEVPVLAVAAMVAEGETVFRDARELRVKESDRIESTASLVRALGGEVETGPDWMRIKGKGHIEGGCVESRGDHRIAMSALVAGCASRGPVEIDDTVPIASSDPTFLDTIARLGARLR
jgi:3-phosphoshikimate 1-carboxyvinyltransferase